MTSTKIPVSRTMSGPHDRPDGIKPFARFVAAVYCAACRVEMPAELWPGHYRTKSHRTAAGPDPRAVGRA